MSANHGLFQINSKNPTNGHFRVSWTSNSTDIPSIVREMLDYNPPETLEFEFPCPTCEQEKYFTFVLATPEEVTNGLSINIKPDERFPMEYPYTPATWQCIDCWLEPGVALDITTSEWVPEFDGWDA